ncbi:MAG TPA: AmmeMemoRadiSam system protein B [Nitrospinota bacterium]|mgnify:FL=1|nr:AmmeMemoRadiSam system protein B [Nitrospinota bacterium]|tara:strand:- start:87740 stop:88555 length:816 start_codon:yes stop_codon:yes gene_type:complete
MNRRSAVAGLFYPSTREEIEAQLNTFEIEPMQRSRYMGAVVPHAGYRYSGSVAASVYAKMEPTETIILIGPNHGLGNQSLEPAISIYSTGAWDTPIGPCEIDELLASSLLDASSLVQPADWAHENEHSLEVQIPFLQLIRPGLKIVPIIIGRMPDSDINKLATDICGALADFGKTLTFVASTDFSHYVSQEKAKILDFMTMKKIIEMDSSGLIDVVRKNNINMCGVQATAVVMDICKARGATSAELVSYQTSGDTTGDLESVVGYGGLLIN